MKSLMITGPASGAGKTLVSLGITRALKNRGKDVRAFKTGPDFLDGKLLSKASGKRAGNLDLHMMGEEGLKIALALNQGAYGLVEGAMGYFDGIYNSYENSSYDIGRILKIPAILVYSPKGEMFSAIPKIKGMVDFEDSKIQGIILNKTKKHLYPMYKEQIEKYIGIRALGYLEEDEDLAMGSRGLGLDFRQDKGDLDNFLDKLADKIKKTINMDELIENMGRVEVDPYSYPKKRNIKIAIAYDQAFFFYYKENLDLLENICQVEYFSPLKDKDLPQCDLLYIGGGYPELYKERLAENQPMIRSIRSMAENYGFIYGEAGGLMYLADSIEGYPMCGILDGRVSISNRLDRFGYTQMELRKDNILGHKGDIIYGQEFHKSRIDLEGDIYNISKPKSKRKWKCGYQYKNTFGAYQHIHFLGNKKALFNLLRNIENHKGGKSCI